MAKQDGEQIDWNKRPDGDQASRSKLEHRRRIETEFWEGMKTGKRLKVVAYYEVGPKGFKAVRDHGTIVSVEEVRPLTLERVILLDEETGEEIG